MEIDIVKHIPFGKDNAVSRSDLALKVGCSDRTMRDLINSSTVSDGGDNTVSKDN